MSDAAKGGYLCYSPDSFGTLSLHWSETKVENALAFFAAGKPIPPFKFKTNQGRFQLQKGTDDKTKFFEGWGAFLKEGLCRFNATKIEMYGKANSREDVQLVLLDKSMLKVIRVMPGETWEGSCDEVLSFAIVPKDNTAFKVGTLEASVFMTKAKDDGIAHEVSLN